MTRRRAGYVAVTAALAAIVVGGIALTRHGRWTAADIDVLANDARRVRFARGSTAFEATVIRFDRGRVVAQLVDVADGQTLGDVAGEATLAINGGYFDASFNPLGLYRIDGREVSPMLARPPLSGVVTIDARGRLDLGAGDDPAASSAFQAGPFVIDPGGAVGIRSDDGKLAERTLLACDERSIAVVVTTPTTLRALAECLHDRPEAFGLARVDRALNLDGGPSTGFVLNVDRRVARSLPRGQIRSALVFTASAND